MGTGTVAAAENASLRIQRTVAVGAAETGVDGYALHLAAEHPFQFSGKAVVAF